MSDLDESRPVYAACPWPPVTPEIEASAVYLARRPIEELRAIPGALRDLASIYDGMKEPYRSRDLARWADRMRRRDFDTGEPVTEDDRIP